MECSDAKNGALKGVEGVIRGWLRGVIIRYIGRCAQETRRMADETDLAVIHRDEECFTILRIDNTICS